jgi:hypothetical protein
MPAPLFHTAEMVRTGYQNIVAAVLAGTSAMHAGAGE